MGEKLYSETTCTTQRHLLEFKMADSVASLLILISLLAYFDKGNLFESVTATLCVVYVKVILIKTYLLHLLVCFCNVCDFE